LRRITKSPFLYLALISLVLGSAVIIFVEKKGDNLSFACAGLDDSHYLFSQTCKAGDYPVLGIIEEAVLSPSSPPVLIKGKTFAVLEEEGYNSTQPRKEIENYIVEKGDTIKSVAEKFAISNETLLLANNLTSKATLKPGQALVILPVSGTMHIVEKGESLSAIAKLYQAKAQDISDFNILDEEGIKPGDFLIIPGGKKPKDVPKYTTVPLSNSYFICPIPGPCRITQGLHWFNAIDFSNGKCGEPVFAAAGGEVQRAGYITTGGNYVRILHENGAVTYYGHLAGLAVSAGKKVSQGQVIGYVGHTGHTIPAGSAGCHVHFDVRFAANPFAKYKKGTSLSK